jgi:hypothetical protein
VDACSRWEQPLQVANAVPPKVARAVADHLARYLDQDDVASAKAAVMFELLELSRLWSARQ